MSGKTTLATLVSHYIHEKYVSQNQPSFVINMSAVSLMSLSDDSNISSNWRFDEKFFEVVGVRFDDLDKISMSRPVYLIIDEFHFLFNSDPPNSGLRPFWMKVKQIMNTVSGQFRILILSAYSSSIVYSDQGILVQFDRQSTFGLETLLFTNDELKQYLKNYLQVYSLVDGNAAFFDQVRVMTGNYIGLVRTLCLSLNRLLESKINRSEVALEVVFDRLQ